MKVIKLRGGPLSNSYKEVEDRFGERLIISEAVPQWANMLGVNHGGNPLDGPAYTTKRGHYQRTNIVTKRGVPVFQWMGFEGEVIAR